MRGANNGLHFNVIGWGLQTTVCTGWDLYRKRSSIKLTHSLPVHVHRCLVALWLVPHIFVCVFPHGLVSHRFSLGILGLLSGLEDEWLRTSIHLGLIVRTLLLSGVLLGLIGSTPLLRVTLLGLIGCTLVLSAITLLLGAAAPGVLRQVVDLTLFTLTYGFGLGLQQVDGATLRL